MAEPLALTPVGIVHSSVTDPQDMPHEGVPAEVEVFPAYWPALLDIASNSHLWVAGWLDRADRARLQAEGRHPVPHLRLRGVFGLRSPMRPNPIGWTAARLLNADLATGRLRLDHLDFVDGTPVVDLKRYSAGIDAVFAASTSRDRAAGGESQGDLLRAAVNFHGEWCAGVAAGAVWLGAVLAAWDIAARHPDLAVQVGADGCLADALQGMTGATLGNRRLTVGATPTVTLSYSGQQVTFTPAYDPAAAADQILQTPLARLGAAEKSERPEPPT